MINTNERRSTNDFRCNFDLSEFQYIYPPRWRQQSKTTHVRRVRLAAARKLNFRNKHVKKIQRHASIFETVFSTTTSK